MSNVHVHVYVHENIREPQLPRLRTALKPTCTCRCQPVTQCTGHVSANTRPHQLHCGDWEYAWVLHVMHMQHRWHVNVLVPVYSFSNSGNALNISIHRHPPNIDVRKLTHVQCIIHNVYTLLGWITAAGVSAGRSSSESLHGVMIKTDVIHTAHQHK